MGVYIKGTDVPDINDYNGISCCLYKTLGGQLRLRNNETGQFFDVDTVPPHGRLIDADELHSVLRKRAKEFSNSEYGDGVKCGLADAREYIKIAPTIIPAEEGET